MLSLEEIVRARATAFAAACISPFWVSVYRSSTEAGDVAGWGDEPRFEIWVGGEPFADWYPLGAPAAIMAVLPATGHEQHGLARVGAGHRPP
ncbi:MAG: hypothetical protein ACRDZX_13300, partial [Acidimicrobiales bacterium]